MGEQGSGFAGGHATSRNFPSSGRSHGERASRASLSLLRDRQRKRRIRPGGASQAPCCDENPATGRASQLLNSDSFDHRRRRYNLSALPVRRAGVPDAQREGRTGARERTLGLFPAGIGLQPIGRPIPGGHRIRASFSLPGTSGGLLKISKPFTK